MTSIINPDGTTQEAKPRGSNRRTIEPTGKITGADILELPPEPQPAQEDPLAPSRPDPKLFPRSVPAMSEIVKAVRDEESLIDAMAKPSYKYAGPPRRLSHNEMVEEILASHGVSSQTKFYVISRLGYREENESVYPPSNSGSSGSPKEHDREDAKEHKPQTTKKGQ